MAYDLKYDKLFRAIEAGRQTEVISFFEHRLYDVNESIRYLFEDGKRFSISPLYWAVRHNCHKVCRYLLRHGARPYGALVYEYYPLHEACNRGYDLVVQEFVNVRCDLDKTNNDADTPLHIACMRGHIQCVHILLRAGSDCSLRNKLGHTPLQSAVYHDRTDLVELFKAHNKGIETTPPVSSSHQQAPAVATLAATTGVRVQRSHSLNAGGGSAGVGRSEQPQKRSGGHGRLRATHVRPQSYYEEGGTTTLVIGQKPLTSVTSQSLQSLTSSTSSLSSYPTISTHLQTGAYSSLSPNSPVELDAPKRPSLDQPLPVEHTIKVPQPRKQPDHSPPNPAVLRPHPKPNDGFGTKHGSGGKVLGQPERLPKSTEGSTSTHSANFCPFPSPGSARKETLEGKLSPPKQPHPLSSAARSDHHRYHSDKFLQERLSHPEFNITKRDIQITSRAKSSDVLLGYSSKADKVEQHLLTVSPTREHINSLAASLCASLEPHRSLSTQHLHPVTTTSSPLHPLLVGLRGSLATQAHRYGLSPDHHKSLSELSHSQTSFSTLDSSSSSPSSSLLQHQPSFQEVDFEVVEGPLDRQVWVERGGGCEEVFVTLLLKVQVCDALVQLRSQMNHGDIVLLKVKARLEPETGSMGSASLSLQSDQLPEVVLLNDLPPHPHITSVLYHCRGRTEKLRDYLATPSGNTSCQPSLDSTTALCEKSHSGTTEYAYWNEDITTCNPAVTGTFLFQSAPGVSLDRYFTNFLQSEQKDTVIEEKFLHILAQLLLAVAHLQNNLVSHCAISSRNVYIAEKGERVVLGDFGQAVNLRPKNLDIFRRSLKRLKANKNRKLSPEAEESLAKCNTDTLSSTASQTLHDMEDAFSMSDSYAVGVLFYDLLAGKDWLSSGTNTPFIHTLSFRCNHLLQKLVARNPSERFSALQGAVSCFVLLFGPRTSEVTCSSDCLQWLVSESLKLYLNPVLRDSSTGFSSSGDSGRDSSGHGPKKNRLLYSYLVTASPELVFTSCKLFDSD